MPRTQQLDVRPVASPGLADAPVMDLLCSHFLLTLTLRQAARFNLRRDWNSLLGIVGRHLVWPVPVLARVRVYLAKRWQHQVQACRPTGRRILAILRGSGRVLVDFPAHLLTWPDLP
ncbi:MAG TPA: hypothetical protein PLO07_17920, partial [Rubrivivax sp.]|nr:hypothetical protein [Rubrivivax sp.]